MLEKLIVIPNLVASFMAGHSDLPNPESLTKYQKPAIYAQASQDLGGRLLVQSNLQGAVSGRSSQEERDIKLFNYYKNLTFKKGSSRMDKKEALDFFDYFIERYRNNPYDTAIADILPKAFVYSGILHCCLVENKNIDEAKVRLTEAIELTADNEVKAHALFTLGNIEQYNANANVEGFSIQRAIEFYERTIITASESTYAQEAKKRIELIKSELSQKIK